MIDPASIATAYSGLVAVKDIFQGLAGLKIDVDSLAKIHDAQLKLGSVQDTLFQLREELFTLQNEKQELTRQLDVQNAWKNQLSEYSLFAAPGGATVYVSSAEPVHYICPSCINKKEIHILQDSRTTSGKYRCTGCEQEYPIKPRQDPNAINYPNLNLA